MYLLAYSFNFYVISLSGVSISEKKEQNVYRRDAQTQFKNIFFIGINVK